MAGLVYAAPPYTIEAQLYRDEGFRQSAYLDSEGYWTIGIGRMIDTRKGGGITEAEARILLENDIAECERLLQSLLPWAEKMDYRRYAVLINMCFNLGINGLLTFSKMLTALENEDWQQAAHELLDSKYHSQVGKRAERLATQLMTAEWQ